eukprot:4156753-Amphidinium_carterae.1
MSGIGMEAQDQLSTAEGKRTSREPEQLGQGVGPSMSAEGEREKCWLDGQFAHYGQRLHLQDVLVSGQPACELVNAQLRLESWICRYHRESVPLVAVASKRYELSEEVGGGDAPP